jgi:hypothetical protein
MIPVKLEYNDDGDKIRLHFKYNPTLLKTVKTSFEGRKWLGPIPGTRDKGPKLWEIPVTQRNDFVLQYLQARTSDENPYTRFDAALVEENRDTLIKRIRAFFKKRFPNEELYEHQEEMIAHALITRDFILACEMGTGKTLAAFIYMAMSGIKDWIWVAPNSALRAYHEEYIKWGRIVDPVTMTYDGLKKYVLRGVCTPQGIIFDESAKIKTPTSQRSIAARNLANEVRNLRNEGARISSVGLLSGAPAPLSPVDWWHQCEVACPGFLYEGNVFLFRERLGIFEDADNGAYKKHVTWRDTEEKCATCGELREHECHNVHDVLTIAETHNFTSGVDEVSYLYKRMKGLVLVKLKKDCLDLPEKVYERRMIKPSRDTIVAAKLLAETGTRAIEVLTGLRMLSDGFQYTKEEIGETVCPLCVGKKEYLEYFDPDEPHEYIPEEWVDAGVKRIFDDDNNVIEEKQIEYHKRLVECPNCSGSGRVPKYRTTASYVECPKEAALIEDLEAHEDVGRLNIYAGFTASIDRIVQICRGQGWTTIRADGRGWEGCTPYGEILDNEKLLRIYSEGQEAYPKVVFIGQPGAAGEGLTLTASPTTIYWSNDFIGSNRIQSEDRGHRIGMDKERGGRIVDYIHLPSDLYVLKNLQQKKDLQKQSMTGIRQCFEEGI